MLGTPIGRLAPATATMPVPITEANQLGPSTTRPSIGDPKTPNHRSARVLAKAPEASGVPDVAFSPPGRIAG